MQLRDLGEFGLIGRIARAAARAGVAGGRDVVLGIGDDAALLRPRAGEDVAVTTDALVEGVHFAWATMDARTLGRRALLVNLSDLSAMGARPLGCTIALAAPPALPAARALGLMRGAIDVARAAGCPLVGGNVTRATETSLHVTAVGAVRRGRALRRDAARAGDRVFVTGVLGAAALAVARARRERVMLRRLPPLRLAAGRALGTLRERGACIDVSDGLLADLGHVLESSGVGASIVVRALPLVPGFARACARAAEDPVALALCGGEDYELLFTLRAGAPDAGRLGRRLGAPVAEIGRIEARGGLRLLGLSPEQRRRLARVRDAGGWRHF
ncbi:MAG TPA: thiamine-phosphate kinase [Myxococcota bacterium]|jgi:thiamine-monophosphate kinase|nr:thiamine-phosphate kinase [Myxococcota bacterium]